MDFLWQEVTGGKDVVIDLVKVLLAFVIAIPVGWERHVSDRNLGLRTFPIVAIGACGFILLTEEFANGDPDAIARALMNGGRVILADEPTANLDSKRGRQMVEMLAHLVRTRGKAGVMVTHDERMLDLCDRVIRIADGVLTAA